MLCLKKKKSKEKYNMLRDKLFTPDYPSSANVGLIACDAFNDKLIEEKQIKNTNSMHQRYSLKKVLEKVLLSVNAARHFFVAMITNIYLFIYLFIFLII